MSSILFNREEYIKDIEDSFTKLELRIQNLNSLHLFDINTIAEDFICGLMNTMYGYSLENLNIHNTNYPGIDLGSEKDRIAIQVTSDGGRRKIDETIKAFNLHGYYKKYSRLMIVVIGNKPNYRKDFDTNNLFSFDPSKDIVDIKGLLKEIKGIPDIQKIHEIHGYVANEIDSVERQTKVLKDADKCRKRVEALCRSRLKSIGVSEDKVETIIQNDLYSDKYKYITESNANYLVGEYGLGKSHAIYIIFLQKYKEYLERKYNKLPCYTTAREIVQSGGIQAWIGEMILDAVELLILIDGLDEVDYDHAVQLMDEIDYIRERYNNTQIIVASRNMPVINGTNYIHMKRLDDESMDKLYKLVTGADRGISIYKRNSSKSFNYWKMMDRPFFLLLYALYIEKEKIIIKNDIDIVALFVDKVLERQRLKSVEALNQLKQLAILTVNNNMGSIHASKLAFDISELLKTGLISMEQSSFYSFSFPIVAQWLAALALKEGFLDSYTIIRSKRALMKWRYPLSILFCISSFDSTKDLFSEIVRNYPGISGLIISDGIRSETQINGAEDSYECGEKLQHCMTAWTEGLGKTAELLKLSEGGNKPNTLYVNTLGNYITYSWSVRNLSDTIITYGENDIQNGFFYKCGRRLPAQDSWPWILTYETIKDRLKLLIKKRRIPVHGQLEKELVWKQALKQQKKGSLYGEPLKLKELLRFNPPKEMINSFVYDQKVFYQVLSRMSEEGAVQLMPPYPVGDLELLNGGFIWDVFSKEQMLKRVQFEFSMGIKEYTYIVEHFFQKMTT